MRVDFEETFAPVIQYSAVRLLLAIAVERKLEARHIDIRTAYLNSEVDEEIYVHQPKGFIATGNEKSVCRLNKAVYGLKQGARQWDLKLNESLKSLNFVTSVSQPCVFINKCDHNHMVGADVDDLVVNGSEKQVKNFKMEIGRKLTSDKGKLKFCLNM